MSTRSSRTKETWGYPARAYLTRVDERTPVTGDGAEIERAFAADGWLPSTSPGWFSRRSWGSLAKSSVLLALATWAPLLVASSAEGAVLDHPGAFLRDVGIHVRLLVALPLLVFAARPIGERLRGALRYLDDAGLIDPEARPRVGEIVGGVRALRRSFITHAALVLVVAAISLPLPWMAPPVPTWSHPAATFDSPGPLSIAGWIDVLWSSAIYRLLVARWLLELLLWFVLLARLARLPLRTSALHHDRLGGLGVVADAHDAFAWVLFALSSGLAARLASHVALTNDDGFSHWPTVVAYCVVAPLPFLAPMLVFVAPLERSRRRVLSALSGAIAGQAGSFAEQYLAPGPGRRSIATGAEEVMILADIGPTFERVYAVWGAPFRREHYLWLFAAGALPMVGFFLGSVPSEEVARALRWLIA